MELKSIPRFHCLNAQPKGMKIYICVVCFCFLIQPRYHKVKIYLSQNICAETTTTLDIVNMLSLFGIICFHVHDERKRGTLIIFHITRLNLTRCIFDSLFSLSAYMAGLHGIFSSFSISRSHSLTHSTRYNTIRYV